MVQPISLLMSHFNVENTARLTPAALAASQDTVQGQELVQDSIRITQTVQANEAAAEAQKVHRRTEDEEREDRRRNAHYGEEGGDGKESGESAAPDELTPGIAPKIQEVRTGKKGFDVYV